VRNRREAWKICACILAGIEKKLTLNRCDDNGDGDYDDYDDDDECEFSVGTFRKIVGVYAAFTSVS